MYKKNHIAEFEKHAKEYDSFAVVQKKVAKELMSRVDFKPKNILDIGCGTGEVYKNISWDIDRFVGVDSSATMCQLHPKSDKIEIICADFESENFKDKIKKGLPFDLVVSSSSLQWAQEIDLTLKFYSSLSDKIAFSIFTNGTFKDIYKTTKRKSFLPSFDSIYSLSKSIKNFQIERKIYKIEFEDNISMLRYIKNSGIGGGNKVLNYKEIKYLLYSYIHTCLEFEVAFITK